MQGVLIDRYRKSLEKQKGRCKGVHGSFGVVWSGEVCVWCVCVAARCAGVCESPSQT